MLLDIASDERSLRGVQAVLCLWVLIKAMVVLVIHTRFAVYCCVTSDDCLVLRVWSC